MKITQQELNKKLWAAADSSRVQLDASVYKDYVLTILFYKYLSDLAKKYYEQYKERFGDDEDRIREKLRLERFYIPQDASFDHIYSIQEKDNIGEEINKALHKIEDENREKLEGVFHVDFNAEAILGKLQQRNKMIQHLLQDFHELDLSEIGEDVIGNS